MRYSVLILLAVIAPLFALPAEAQTPSYRVSRLKGFDTWFVREGDWSVAVKVGITQRKNNGPIEVMSADFSFMEQSLGAGIRFEDPAHSQSPIDKLPGDSIWVKQAERAVGLMLAEEPDDPIVKRFAAIVALKRGSFSLNYGEECKNPVYSTNGIEHRSVIWTKREGDKAVQMFYSRDGQGESLNVNWWSIENDTLVVRKMQLRSHRTLSYPPWFSGFRVWSYASRQQPSAKDRREALKLLKRVRKRYPDLRW